MKKKTIAQMVERWRKRLLLNEWQIFIEFPDKDPEDDGGGATLASISPCPVYMEAKMRIYPAWFRRSPEVREHALIHELCHCITQEAWDALRHQHNGALVHENMQRDIMERLTQRLTNAVKGGYHAR